MASYRWLEQGKRLHLQHGPIDLIIEACGESEAVARAYRQAHEAFQSILSDLVEELSFLRQPLSEGCPVVPSGCVARRMVSAALPYTRRGFVTPMIAVAGSVADYVLQAMLCACSLSRASVNNGGDIALWLADGENVEIGVCENVQSAQIGSRISIEGRDSSLGIATSGWRGRSHSLGIADAVTVLAESAAAADVAATLVANAVDAPGSKRVHRRCAVELSPDSDLGDRLVTVGVDRLTRQEVRMALDAGEQEAQALLCCGLIESAYVSLQCENRVCGSQTHCLGAVYA